MTNESCEVSVKRSFKTALAIVFALILIVFMFATNAFAGTDSEYDVVINDNGSEFTITTEETEPTEILNEANIALGSNDKVDFSGFVSGKGGQIVVDRLNKVNIKSKEVITTYEVYADTVSEAFDEIALNTTGCVIDYAGDTLVSDGMIITVSMPVNVTINFDGQTKSFGVGEGTVSDALSFVGISLNGDDYTSPSYDTVLTDGMTITVNRVEYKTTTKTEVIKYSTEEKSDSTMNIGESKIEVAGQNGEKIVEYKIKYVNGKEASKEVLKSTTTKEAVKEVKIVGTKAGSVVANGVSSYNGYTLGQTISGKYTHYCVCMKCCGKTTGVTSSGIRIHNGMTDMHYVACNWLPLGSVINYNGTNYTVVDRGGSGLSRAGRFDIYTPAGHQAAIRGGTGSCTITLVRFGW